MGKSKEEMFPVGNYFFNRIYYNSLQGTVAKGNGGVGTMKLTDAIGKRVEKLLNEKGVNQYFLFKNGGIPRSTVSQTLHAKKGKVTVDTVFQIASTLDISLKEFFDDPMFDDIED